jgi:TonB-dependent SusC/RagA subfamily outer membrane receptor
MHRPFVKCGLGVFSALLLALTAPIEASAQGGTVTGLVTDAESGQPLPTVQVYVQGTSYGALSATDGRYSIPNVPPGSYTLIAQRIGYQETRQADVSVAAGGTATANIEMNQTVLALQGIVATGLIDPVEGVRSPVTVGRITAEMMPVAASGAAVQNLQGRMAGVTVARGSGQPGANSTIILRTPTSVTTSGRSVEPLIVVDGVILGSNTTNIDALDIESMEVIKGAAASSLYGSRANAGVIAITTKRGSGLQAGQTQFSATQFSARSEIGWTAAIGDLNQPTHHHYLMDAAQTTYVDVNGNPVTRENRVPGPVATTFMDNVYPVPIYDNNKNVFRPAGTQTHNFMVAQNGVTTNFAVTANRYLEDGPLVNNEGYQRNSLRINLDHRFGDGVSLSFSGFHSRDLLDQTTNLSFSTLYRIQPDINLTATDENGDFFRVADLDNEIINPLWAMGATDASRRRARTTGSAQLRWEPAVWVGFMASASYDRQDTDAREFVERGVVLEFGEEDQATGELALSNDVSNTINSEAQVQFRRDIGALNARTTFRALLEKDSNAGNNQTGRNFYVAGVPDINAAATVTGGSSESEVRSLGYLVDTAFDYAGKYVFTALARRDGSSLFGPDNRWHTYYRLAGAWR